MGAFLDAEEAINVGNELRDYFDIYGRRLAATALNATHQQDLIDISSGIKKVTEGIEEIIDDLRDKDPFGSEESYWTTFRLFCIEKNRGQIFTLADITRYLARTYDMTQEKPETIAEALGEWMDDFEQDAFSKFGIKGRLVKLAEDQFTFALVNQTDEYTVPKKRHPKVSTHKRSYDIDSTEVTKELVVDPQVMAFVLAQLEQGPIKQPVLRRMLKERFPEIKDDGTLSLLNAITQTEAIYKFKPTQSGSAVYALEPFEPMDYRQGKVDQENRQEPEELNIEMGVTILAELANVKEHLRKLEPVELWRRINRSTMMPTKAETAAIKRAARLMSRLGITEAGEAKKGTGSAPRSGGGTNLRGQRSKKTRAFKIGLVSYEVKAEIKQLMQQRGNNLDAWLEEKWQAHQIQVSDKNQH